MRRTGNSIIACADFNHMIALKNLYLIIPNNTKYLSLILHQLNSKLFSYVHRTLTAGDNKAFAQFPAHYVERLPCKVNETLVNESNKLLSEINKKNIPNKTKQDIEQKIDRMIYKLYELTNDEIAVVEGQE